MGLNNTFGRLRIENESGTVYIADINTLVVPDTWLVITGPDEATLVVGDVDSLTSLTNITIDADTDANGSGTIALRTRNLDRLTVNNDGTLTAAGKKLTLGDATALDAAKIDLKTQSNILVSLSTQTFNFVGSGPGGASYANHTFGLFYNEPEVAGDPTFALAHEPKFSQAGAPYQTEIYYSWEDPTHTFSIRPWGFVTQHATGDTSFTMQGEIVFLENLSSGAAQTALWKEVGVLEFTNGTVAQITFPNNSPAIVGYDAAGTSTYSLIKISTANKVLVDPGGLGAIFAAGVTATTFTADEFIHKTTPTTKINFGFSNIITLDAGGNIVAVVDANYFELRKPLTWETDNTIDLGIRSSTNFRPRDIKAGRDIYAGGVLIAGTGPTTLTDAAGKILSAALNTVGATVGGTGLATVAQGDLLYGSASNTWSALAKNATATRYLSNTGTSNNPAWAQIDLTNGVTGALPIANGGTGDTGTAWGAWTPTVTAVTGTFTSVSGAGRYKTVGKTVFFNVRVTITTNGTAAGAVKITLPATAANITAYQVVSGRETSVTSLMLTGAIQANTTTMYITKYDGTYLGANGYTLDLSGVYEST